MLRRPADLTSRTLESFWTAAARDRSRGHRFRDLSGSRCYGRARDGGTVIVARGLSTVCGDERAVDDVSFASPCRLFGLARAAVFLVRRDT